MIQLAMDLQLPMFESEVRLRWRPPMSGLRWHEFTSHVPDELVRQIARGDRAALTVAQDVARAHGCDGEVLRCATVEALAYWRFAARGYAISWSLVHRWDTMAFARGTIQGRNPCGQLAQVARLHKRSVQDILRRRNELVRDDQWPGDIDGQTRPLWAGDVWGTRLSYRQRDEVVYSSRQ